MLNFAQIKRITALCGAILPDEFASRLEAVQDDKDAQFRVGVDFAIRQCQELLDRGAVEGIHFYTLNKSRATIDVCRALTAKFAA